MFMRRVVVSSYVEGLSLILGDCHGGDFGLGVIRCHTVTPFYSRLISLDYLKSL